MKAINTIRSPMWLPYLDKIERLKKERYLFTYKGGQEEVNLEEILSIMIYGDYNDVDFHLLEEIAQSGVPIVVHRRNMARCCWIHSGLRPDQKDTLSKQIIFRQDERKRRHVARVILNAKFNSMKWLISPPQVVLDKSLTVEEMRNIEAHHANKYWHAFYRNLDPNLSRRQKNKYSMALNAVSKFVTGPILRWVTYHHLSPNHGFLHNPTEYPSLVYDLIEPYRGMFDKIVYESWQSVGDESDSFKLTAMAVNSVKESFLENIYTGLTRQIISRQELLHGIVLSLKNYLDENQKVFAIPMSNQPNGGRPRKVNFRFYGRSAGKTDFWKVAKEITK